MRKGILAIMGMILTLVFIIVALAGPWYGLSMDFGGGKTDASMSLTSATTNYADGTTKTTIFSDARETAKAAGSDTGIYDVFNITLYLTIFALIVAILAVIFIPGYVFNFGKPAMMKKLGMIFGIITFIIALVAAIYFMASFPGEAGYKTSGGETIGFWYSETTSTYTGSAGPGFAWYLMLIGAIIAPISLIFVFINKRGAPVYQAPPAQ